MKNQILFNILTCNRLHYFKNCIESVLEFVDLNQIEILVCDANTTEPGFDEYLNSVVNRYDGLIRVKKFNDRVPGELYRSMNHAIMYALKKRIEIIHFMQDDYQYLFKNENHVRDIKKLFLKHKNVYQAQANLVWKRKRKKTGPFECIVVNGTNHAVLLKKPLCDNGFTRTDIYKEIGLYPNESSFKRGDTKNMIGEVWLARQGQARNWKRSISLFPNIGMCYEVPYVRANKRYGRYFPPKGKYYLKELDASAQETLKINSRKKHLSYIDDICECDGWEPLVSYKRDDNTDIVIDI